MSLSSKQAARSTQHAGQPPPQLRPWSLGTRGSTGTACVCGMVEQARTREQTALGWLFWGRQVEGGRLGAGSRELGLRLGSFTGGGQAGGLGWELELELELDFGPVGTIPTMGRFRWSQRLQHCRWMDVTGASPGTDRGYQFRSIPDSSPWRLVTLTLCPEIDCGDSDSDSNSSFSLGRSRLYTVMSAFQRRPGSGVMPMLVGDGVLGGARGGGRERNKAGVEVDDGNEGGRKGSERKERRDQDRDKQDM